jgi:hypothetical protein
MNSTDHYRRPAAREDWQGERVHHVPCAGLLKYDWLLSRWACAGCKQTWALDTIRGMSKTEADVRFFAKVSVSPEAHALVWVDDPVTKKRHTQLVPAYEAAGKERVGT